MSNGWPKPAKPKARIRLELSASADDADIIRNLSAGTRVGDTLFVAADERAAIDRLVLKSADCWGEHMRFELKELIALDAPDEEIDIEGLAADGDWLWVIGSHARTRPKPKKGQDRIDLAKLANLNDTRPRCVLARLPLVKDGDAVKPVPADGDRAAAMVKQSKDGSKLAALIAADALLAPFTAIPAKEGGIDVEGVAVCGERIALGMRGPVIRTHALLVEVEWEEKKAGRIGLKGGLVKRLLDLEGLGVRDLKRCGDDLLILAGPTTGLSGPCALYRWRGWANEPGSGADTVALHKPERLFDIPFGRGVDHPEGLALWEEGASVLVLYDSPAEARIDGHAIVADLFKLDR